jgi:hypothetical protein
LEKKNKESEEYKDKSSKGKKGTCLNCIQNQIEVNSVLKNVLGVKMNKSQKSKIGRTSRQAGKRFELLVRKDLEEQGFYVVKWTNQVDLKNNKLVPAKSKFNPYLGRVLASGTGFPDFMVHRRKGLSDDYEVNGVEAKLNKYLDAEEKKKAQWLINNHVFSKILVAYKKERGKIEYEQFDKKE